MNVFETKLLENEMLDSLSRNDRVILVSSYYIERNSNHRYILSSFVNNEKLFEHWHLRTLLKFYSDNYKPPTKKRPRILTSN